MSDDPFDLSLEDFALPQHKAEGLSLADFAPPKRKRPATLAALDEEGPNSSPPIDRPGDPDYVAGRLHLGNIDLGRRPIVKNADGSISTVRSISANLGHGEVLLPTVSDDGRIMSDQEAIGTYQKTGRHLGIFDTPANATAYAQQLHESQGRLYSGRRDMSQLGAGLRTAGALPASTPTPEHSPLYNLLGLDVAGDTLAGAGRTAVNTAKALPEELNRGVSDAESSLGGLARASGQALERAADKPVFAGPRLPGAQQGILAPVYRAVADPLKSLGGEVEDIAGRQQEQADAKLKGNPEADSILGRALQGVPLLTTLAATGGATGATAGMGLLGAGGGLKQAEDAGATPGQAWAAGGLQGASDALLGQIGAVPLVGKLLHGVPVAGAADAVLALAKQGGSGALQAIGMDVAHGLARKLTYAKDTGLDPAELAKNAAAQALLQGAMEAPGIRMAGEPAAARSLPVTRFQRTPGPTPEFNELRGGTWYLHGDSDFYGKAQGGFGDNKLTGSVAPQNPLVVEKHPFGAGVSAAKLLRPDIGRQIIAANADSGPRGVYDALESAGVDEAHALQIASIENPGERTTSALDRLGTDAARGRGHDALIEMEGSTPHEVVMLHPHELAPRSSRSGEEGFVRNPFAAPEPVAPFRGTWPDFLASRDMGRGDFAVLTAEGKRALRSEYDAALDAHRELAAAARAAAVPPRPGILTGPEPVHPAVEAAVDAVAPPLTPSTPAPSSAFPSEVYNRLVQGKPLRLAQTDLERDVGQAAKGLWPTGLLRTPADVQLLHDTLAGGGDLDAAVATLARQAPQKAKRIAPPTPAPEIATPRPSGLAGTAVTDAGTELPFRYGLANAPDLVTSHLRLGDGSLAPNPDFPPELQPRDRSRSASRLQVDRMVNSLDPERLAESRLASQGAPLVGPDGAIESGNARSLAIGAAYQGGPQAAGYRLWLEQNAARFGLDPAHVRALDQPVLVRHRLDVPGLDRVRLAQEANQSDVATMSRSERAAVDARAFTPELLDQYTPNGSGELASPGNRAFALGFLQRTTSPAELGAVVDPRGQLSQEGQARLHAALLAGAYQDPGLVSRMTEATDDNTRSLSRALATEAPAFIGLRQGAASGSVHPGLDLGPDIAAAANKLSELRAAGQRVPNYLAQQGLFGVELSPESQSLLSLFDEHKRSPSRIAETLHRYVELATAAGDPRQQGLVPQEAPSKADLLERAATTWNQAGGLLPFEEPGHASRPEPTAVVADHLAATLPPEHVAAFTPGDSGAAESPTNATAVRETVAGLPAAKPAEADEGTARWLLGSALGDQELAHRVAESQDRKLSRLADPLASVAPSLAEAPPELRGYLRQVVDAYASTREAGETGPEIARLGRLLGHDAPEEVHRIASFLSENAGHPEAVAQYLHRVAELHQQSGGATGGEGQLSLSQLLEMAADRDQRQAAGSVIPMESSFPVARSAVTGKPGEAGFIDLRGPRFGEAAPIRRWFTREGKYAAMGRDFAERTKTWETEKDFRVKATEKRILANVRDYGTALKDQMDLLKHADVAPPGALFGPTSTTEEVHQYMRAGIMGENDLSEVSPPLQEAAVALRAHLTEQSRAYLQRPDLPATLKAVIAENLDSYFPRTFERITDPKGYAKGIKKDFDAARDAGAPRGQSWKISEAADWAQQQHPDWSREDAEGYAFKLLNDDPQAAYAVARGTQAQKGAMGSESRGNLKARLGLPEELDNLLGLHADPTRSYQIGAMRAARDLATYDLHSKVARMGSADPTRPDGLTPDGQRPIFVDRPTPDLPVRVGGKGPLAEKYTSEQVAAAVRGMGSLSPTYTGFMHGYMLFNGAIKTGKIALNVPMGVARNMLTWPSLLLAGGHWVNAFPAKYAWETAKALPEAIEANLGARQGSVLKFAKRLAYSLPLANGETVGDHLFPRGQKLADLRAEVQRLTEKGILGQSTAADDLHFYTGQQEEPTAGQRVQKIVRDLGGIWSGEHDLGKHIVFKSEVANLKWANPDLPTEEIERMAAERTLATTPSRSEVSQGVRAIRAAPGISPFPTFAAERFRNMKNNAMIAWEDLNSTNPQMKVLGASRAAGLLTALTLAGGGASKMLQVLWNTTKEDADALREFLPEYLKNHQIAVSDRTGGKIRYADISPQMPLTGVTDPAMALLRGIHQGSTRDGMIDAAQEFARPFLDEEFALKTALDLRANQQSDGNLFDSMTNLAREHPQDIQRRPIYLPGGPAGVVAGQVGKYVWHQDAPAMALEAERFARANDVLPNTNARGKRYTNRDELAALNGVRFTTIDMNAALTSVGYDLKDALTESKRYFTGERSSSQNDPKTVLDARAAANENWKNAFEIGLKKVAAARQSRIADYAIRQNLRISGVPPIVIGQLMAGRYSALPLRMPYRQPVDYAGAGAASGDGE